MKQIPIKQQELIKKYQSALILIMSVGPECIGAV